MSTKKARQQARKNLKTNLWNEKRVKRWDVARVHILINKMFLSKIVDITHYSTVKIASELSYGNVRDHDDGCSAKNTNEYESEYRVVRIGTLEYMRDI